ncbi:ABC transporter ATP-binding protein/permease [Clostridium senegalense]|uniref:ABC transporter ATP-binding protein n=1 Tax=Clostridium senegalense TaxID=1465809 RepID=UPI001C126222|nr:ABC transporter ATP-binding protein [Clostridium senegalense]MBU5227094.1 ABC transporter ATP-binding protein/permease [Clostridium senegalense]
MDKKNRSVKVNVLFLLKNAWRWEKKIFFYFSIFTVVTALVPFISIFLPKFLIDELTGLKRPNVLINILVVFFIISSISNFLTTYLDNIAFPKMLLIRLKFMNLMQEKCMTMDFEYTENSKILNDIETCSKAIGDNTNGIEGVYHKLFELFGAVIAFLGYITIVLTLSPWILLYLLANVSFVYYLTMKIKKYRYSKKDDLSNYSRKRNYIYDIMYNFSYGKDIRIFNLSLWLQDKFNLFNNSKVNIESTIKNKEFKVSIVSIVLLLIREGLVYFYLIYNVLKGTMSIGNFTMYFTTISGFASWMQTILDNIAHINAQNLYINDFRDFLEFENKKENNNEFNNIPKDTTYEIEFKNVSFKYPNSDRYIYKNLSLKIKKGQRLAIVGINGAGKTTFVKLITRLYEPTEGEIFINGINISTLNKSEYYKLFSVVFQEIKIFAFSIAENIALIENELIDRNKVIQCIKKAGLTNKVNSLENGIDTSLLKILDSQGIELSGGENQRIALARALYKNGKVIILDEPTSALDPIAEYNIYKKFDEMIEDKTAIYISHRLSSTRFCDVIAFFEDGEIKEYGTHDELMKKEGKYYSMFNVQASYYAKENLERECV